MQAAGHHLPRGCYLLPELAGADEAFITVSTGEIVQVAELEGRVIGGACPGPVTTRLAAAYRDLVRRGAGPVASRPEKGEKRCNSRKSTG